MAGALDGIRVLDLTRTLAGPFCTQLLGDMGADVIKIEEPSHGDETREWGPFWDDLSTQFVSFNRNKRSIALNLRDKRAVDVCLQLASQADIMIESFRAGTADRMGIGYAKVAELNPRIIYCCRLRLRAHGSDGGPPRLRPHHSRLWRDDEHHR